MLKRGALLVKVFWLIRNVFLQFGAFKRNYDKNQNKNHIHKYSIFN